MGERRVGSGSSTNSPADLMPRRRTFQLGRMDLLLSEAERRTLLAVVDLLLMNAALLGSLALWSHFNPLLLPDTTYAPWFLLLSLLWPFVASVFDLYNLARAATVRGILANCGAAAVVTGVTYLLIPWYTPPLASRGYALGLVALMVVMIVGWRLLYALAMVQPGFKGRLLIVGSGEEAWRLLSEVTRAHSATGANPFRGTGYEVAGLINPDSFAAEAEAGYPVLGNIRQLVALARQYHAYEVAIATNPDSLTPEACKLLFEGRDAGLQMITAVDLSERIAGRVGLENAHREAHQLLDLRDTPDAQLYRAAKRIGDLGVALPGLVLLGVAAALVSLANALWSPGPLLSTEPTIGQRGRIFPRYRFHTHTAHDPQIVSGPGGWLRRLHLEELPLLINLWRGDVSLVGPRPHTLAMAKRLAAQFALYRARTATAPGITGWAQLHFGYGYSLSHQTELEYDLYYAKRSGLYLDVLILLQTAGVAFTQHR
jgi:lipopolysaccharide/colanic/teichoic acid biosynthesis glycosyltransferase